MQPKLRSSTPRSRNIALFTSPSTAWFPAIWRILRKTKAEAALALTMPDKPSDLDDGLLIGSEVAQLKLDADWAVLSACNTAAEDKPGAEALSGLARG